MQNIDSLIKELVPGSFGALITFIGFWVGIGRNIVTKKEVLEIVQNQSPYCKDREFIMERLNIDKENQKDFAEALQRNTEVMNELRIQLATLDKTLEHIENRIR
jgi:hypothetical protein